ncbi:MAG TPA: GNAT family N-acetyltransferase [Tepidisphaeraceae bacterium]|jgi:GNAT superfamily N-acetyltransferase
MSIRVEPVDLAAIRPMRAIYRQEMDCQVIHDSIHPRPGWSLEYQLRIDGAVAGYGSIAVAGPWKDKPTVYEFFVLPEFRSRAFDLFEALLAATSPVAIETQSNGDPLAVMIHVYGRGVESESILFHDRLTTALPPPPGARFRRATAEDKLEGVDPEQFDTHGVIEMEDGTVAASGGILFHYNPPYGDIYMDVRDAFRRRGFGSYLVQELKRVAREHGNIPAARCGVNNVASRKTLQKAGFVPCGHILTGSLHTEPKSTTP